MKAKYFVSSGHITIYIFVVQFVWLVICQSEQAASDDVSFGVPQAECFPSITHAVRSGTMEFGGHGLEEWYHLLISADGLYSALTPDCKLRHYAPTNAAVAAYATQNPLYPVNNLLLNHLTGVESNPFVNQIEEVESILSLLPTEGNLQACAKLNVGHGQVRSSTGRPANILASLPLCGGGWIHVVDQVLGHTCRINDFGSYQVDELLQECEQVQQQSYRGHSIEIYKNAAGQYFVQEGNKVRRFIGTSLELAQEQAEFMASYSPNNTHMINRGNQPQSHAGSRRLNVVKGSLDAVYVNYESNPSTHAKDSVRITHPVKGSDKDNGCTGTFVSDNVVLTAAHCFQKTRTDSRGIEFLVMDMAAIQKSVVDEYVGSESQQRTYKVVSAEWNPKFDYHRSTLQQEMIQYDWILLIISCRAGDVHNYAGTTDATIDNIRWIQNQNIPLSYVSFSQFPTKSCGKHACEQSDLVKTANCYFQGILSDISAYKHIENVFYNDCDIYGVGSGGSITMGTYVYKDENETIDYEGLVVGIMVGDIGGQYNLGIPAAEFTDDVTRLRKQYSGKMNLWDKLELVDGEWVEVPATC